MLKLISLILFVTYLTIFLVNFYDYQNGTVNFYNNYNLTFEHQNFDMVEYVPSYTLTSDDFSVSLIDDEARVPEQGIAGYKIFPIGPKNIYPFELKTGLTFYIPEDYYATLEPCGHFQPVRKLYRNDDLKNFVLEIQPQHTGFYRKFQKHDCVAEIVFHPVQIPDLELL